MVDKRRRIAVLGAGNGGVTFAGHLASQGYKVRLYEDPRFAGGISEIASTKQIHLKGDVTGVGTIDLASTDMAEVMHQADIVFVVVPAFAHETIIEKALPFLNKQIVVFNPDNYGSLLLARRLRESRPDNQVRICGTTSLMYACRRAGASAVNVMAVKKAMPLGVFPATQTGPVLKEMQTLYPQFVEAGNVLGTSLGNMNMIVHCPTAVLNAGRIEDTNGDFMFYWQGMTKSVCRVEEAIDNERLHIGQALGLQMSSTLDTLRVMYPREAPGTDLHSFLTRSNVHGGHGPDAPKELTHRYLSEDVPCGLVPMSCLGDLCGLASPVADAIITLASRLNGEDYRTGGRTMEKLGFSGWSKQRLMDYVNS